MRFISRPAWALVLLSSAGTLAACATALETRPPTSDPSSPRAEEAPVPPPPELARPDPLLALSREVPATLPPGEHAGHPPPTAPAPGGAPEPHHHHGGAASRAPANPVPEHQHEGAHDMPAPTPAPAPSATYVCPMHPDVHSTRPGDKCPKCGMQLVPSERGAR